LDANVRDSRCADFKCANDFLMPLILLLLLFTDKILSVFSFLKTGVQLLISGKSKSLIISSNLFMFDNLPIFVKIKVLIINGICFEKNRKCLHFKKLNTHKLNSDFRFA
jgi:hypothetical protein